jgi:hypothetical protein
MRLSEKLERFPTTSALYRNRITTLSVDTEHVETVRGSHNLLHQVGLAYTKTLDGAYGSDKSAIKPPAGGHPSRHRNPQKFYTHNKVQGLTLNISIPCKLQDEASGSRLEISIPC